MSGSSLDGVDLAAVDFSLNTPLPFDPEHLTWSLAASETVPFPKEISNALKEAPHLPAKKLFELHTKLGRFFGKVAKHFVDDNQLNPDFLSSHGHTVFHHPEKGFTLQIGDGASIASSAQIPVICDFRGADIALGGQGTPIAPAADRYLFSGYDFYLNIGGIANISSTLNNELVAFDIAPANQLLNHLAQKIGLKYDNNGQVAASGQLNPILLEVLNGFEFYKKDWPKSLDNQWIMNNFIPILDQSNDTIDNILHTTTQHIAIQIAQTIAALKRLEHKPSYRLFATGGGAFNSYLMNSIQQHSDVELVLPDSKLIAFKEAILMSLMGLLRIMEVPNCFASVTGAKKDSVGGAIYDWK